MSATLVDVQRAREAAAAVPDPELPMVTIGELGILRDVELDGADVVVTLTPTYSGCPAMHEIAHDVRRRLQDAGFDDVRVRHQLSPAWTSDWITAAGRRALAANGIAPPGPAPSGPVPLTLVSRSEPVRCPQCGCAETIRTAAFSGTACKALYRCTACHEPFEYLKPI